jgi:hypothetical protein
MPTPVSRTVSSTHFAAVEPIVMSMLPPAACT